MTSQNPDDIPSIMREYIGRFHKHPPQQKGVDKRAGEFYNEGEFTTDRASLPDSCHKRLLLFYLKSNEMVYTPRNRETEGYQDFLNSVQVQCLNNVVLLESICYYDLSDEAFGKLCADWKENSFVAGVNLPKEEPCTTATYCELERDFHWKFNTSLMDLDRIGYTKDSPVSKAQGHFFLAYFRKLVDIALYRRISKALTIIDVQILLKAILMPRTGRAAVLPSNALTVPAVNPDQQDIILLRPQLSPGPYQKHIPEVDYCYYRLEKLLALVGVFDNAHTPLSHNKVKHLNQLIFVESFCYLNSFQITSGMQSTLLAALQNLPPTANSLPICVAEVLGGVRSNVSSLCNYARSGGYWPDSINTWDEKHASLMEDIYKLVDIAALKILSRQYAGTVDFAAILNDLPTYDELTADVDPALFNTPPPTVMVDLW